MSIVPHRRHHICASYISNVRSACGKNMLRPGNLNRCGVSRSRSALRDSLFGPLNYPPQAAARYKHDLLEKVQGWLQEMDGTRLGRLA